MRTDSLRKGGGYLSLCRVMHDQNLRTLANNEACNHRDLYRDHE